MIEFNENISNEEMPTCANPLLADVYPFIEIENYIIGDYSISDWFSFTIHSDKAPSEGDKIQIADKTYEVESVIDDTDEEEYEQGLSYSKVWLSLYVC